jgi:hypothetical protein
MPERMPLEELALRVLIASHSRGRVGSMPSSGT